MPMFEFYIQGIKKFYVDATDQRRAMEHMPFAESDFAWEVQRVDVGTINEDSRTSIKKIYPERISKA